jgi:hypothetical protein
MRRLLIVTALGLLLQEPAGAADRMGTYTVFGRGSQTCAQWLAKDSDAESRESGSWILGYVSAYNAWVHDGANLATGAAATEMIAWVARYCLEQPRRTLAEAAQALIYEMLSRR